jgi:integrase
MTRRRGGISGVAVYKRGGTWSYRIDLEPHALTGARQRENRGGFGSEDEAWAAAIRAKDAIDASRHVKPSQRRFGEYATEWLTSIEHSVKPSTLVNYKDYLDAYVLPVLGDRKLQAISVNTLNALYRHLLEGGRARPNLNAEMYRRWKAADDAGRAIAPRDLAAATGATIHAARSAVQRYKAGRLPRELGAGLAPKTVRNIQNMVHKMLGTAVAWRYIEHNPAEHASRPRVRRVRPMTWTAEQLGIFLTAANADRFRALWVLVATTGMRRSELAGAERRLLDLDAGTLTIEPTRVVVDGKAVDEDGKTRSARRTIALDPYTVSVLREHLDMLDAERHAWGSDYPDHDKLFCFEDGRLLHPDTITRRFNRLVDRSGLPRITLHGVRHSYATCAMDAGINPKILSERIGHSSMGFTLQTYVQRSEGRDRDAADSLARLITRHEK